MPNTIPALDAPRWIQYVNDSAREADLARVHTIGCGTIGRRGRERAPIGELVEAGAVGISDDGDGIEDDAMMRSVLEAVHEHDTCFMQHCQVPSMTRGAVMNAGPLATRLGLVGWPVEAEEAMIERDLEINASIGARYHAQHVSSGGSVDLLRNARATGQPATGEASPHHLLLTEAACDGYDTSAKMNPTSSNGIRHRPAQGRHRRRNDHRPGNRSRPAPGPVQGDRLRVGILRHRRP